MPSLYQHPRLYDLLQGADTSVEADLLERLHVAHGNGGRAVLEPGCGTGRLLEALARRGWTAKGFDAEPKMLAYARRRLLGLSARVAPGDLRRFYEPATYDLAFCLLGSIRHLLSERDVVGHLRCVAASLREGGLYVVGLDLTDYHSPEPDEETWEAPDGSRTVRQVQMTIPPDARRRREKILQFVSIGRRLLRSEYDLRSYDEREWRALILRSPFELVATYDLWGKKSELDASTRAATFVLKMRPGAHR